MKVSPPIAPAAPPPAPGVLTAINCAASAEPRNSVKFFPKERLDIIGINFDY